MNATQQKFKPILFSTEMVQAILAGRKTQTRRILKNQPPAQTYKPIYYPGQRKDLRVSFRNRSGLYSPFTRFKYQPGDILWVRETFAKPPITAFGVPYIHKAGFDRTFCGWKPSIHMPKEAARIFLKVTNVRVERLNNISENDAMAEGVIFHWYDEERNIKIQNAYSLFKELWQSINGKKHPWESNPWVWVYEFERIEKPEDFN